jgi:hypothetical protein
MQSYKVYDKTLNLLFISSPRTVRYKVSKDKYIKNIINYIIIIIIIFSSFMQGIYTYYYYYYYYCCYYY